MTALSTKHGQTDDGGDSDVEPQEEVEQLDGGEDEIDVEVDGTGTNTPNRFCIDYSKRGTAKCKVCKKNIQKGELRIGMYAHFKDREITNYFHVACSFGKMRRARVDENAVKSSSELDGFENISEEDKNVITCLIQD